MTRLVGAWSHDAELGGTIDMEMNEQNATELAMGLSGRIYEAWQLYVAWRHAQRASGPLALPAPSHVELLPSRSTARRSSPDSPPVPPMLGVGIRRNGFECKLAFRAWHRHDLASDILKPVLRTLSADEIDARVVGPITVSIPDITARYFHTPRIETLRRRTRPLHPGLSIAHHRTTAGTLGAFVETVDSKLHMLSCNHALALANKAKIGDAITQPGSLDGGTKSDRVGSLHSFVNLTTMNNVADAAIASVDDDVFPDSFAIPAIGRLRGHWLEKTPEATFVMKVGRSTGFTMGQITANRLLGIPVRFNRRSVRWFDEVIEVQSRDRPFSLPGDSGALVVDGDQYAVGLLFAQSKDGVDTYLNHFDDVARALQIELVR